MNDTLQLPDKSFSFEENCLLLISTLETAVSNFKKLARRHKRNHDLISILTVIGSVAGPTVIAYVMGKSDEIGERYGIELTVIVIAAVLGASGAAQRVFAFGNKYVGAVRAQMDLEDARIQLSAKLSSWDGTEGVGSESGRQLGTAFDRAQNTLQAVRRSYLLAEMNIVEQQITSSATT